MVLHSPLSIILIIVLVFLVVGALPAWPHSRSWGSAPAGMLFFVLILVLLLWLL